MLFLQFAGMQTVASVLGNSASNFRVKLANLGHIRTSAQTL